MKGTVLLKFLSKIRRELHWAPLHKKTTVDIHCRKRASILK